MSATPAAVNNKVRQRLFRSRALDELPITIEHQRVYILPTRCGIAYLISLLLMLVASINYALNLGYALCFLLTGLFAASLLHTYKNLAGIGIKKISTQECFAGQNAVFDVEVFNATDLPRYGIQLKTKYYATSVAVDANASSVAQLQKNTLTRGFESIERITLTSSYPLGLWRTWCYVHSDSQALIYPKPEVDAPVLPTQAMNSDGDKSIARLSGDIAGLRNYQPGDSQNAIAWKQMARGQGIFVKTFEDEASGGDLVLSLESTKLFDLEEKLSRLTAWIIEADKQNINYQLELNANSAAEQSDSANLTNALRRLAKYQLAS